MRHRIIELIRTSQLRQCHSTIDMVCPCCNRIISRHDGLDVVSLVRQTRMSEEISLKPLQEHPINLLHKEKT